MKIYKKLFEDIRPIFDTRHSAKRYLERYKFISEDILNKIFNDVMKKIISEYDDKEGEYGFHSKSTGIGGITLWARSGDPKLDDKKNHFVIKTLLPIKKYHSYKNVNAVIIVESQIISWAEEKGFTGKKTRNLCESFSNNNNLKKYFGDDFYVSFFEGKLYDFNLDGYILVD